MTLFAEIVATSRRVGETSRRSAKVAELASCLRRLAPEEVEIGTLYLAGEVPQGKIGVGYSVLQGASKGSVATAPSLTLAELDACVSAIAAIHGAGSTTRRAQALAELFARTTSDEREVLLRLLVGELRQGALGGVMVEAIAAAADLPLQDVRRASMYAKQLGEVARAALQEGAPGLAAFQLATLSAIAPMLAQTASDVSDALTQLGGTAAFEWKVDGARVQVHKRGEDIRVYTRNLNDVTRAVPEIVELLRSLQADDLVLDGETIVLDGEGRPQPFQVTMRRFGRKLDVEALRAELPLHTYFFDCLKLNGQSLADRPGSERHEALTRAVPQAFMTPRLVTGSEPQAQAFYDEALARGHEGVMAKALGAPYEAGSRGADWLKIKRTHSLDLVVLAAEWGHGRRTGKLSNLHLGARDPESGSYVMLGKTFKGLTDALLTWQTEAFLARETARDRWTVQVRPELVVEVAFNDIQASPQYPGGLALRFARVKRYRPDKRAEEADTIDTVRRLYLAQGGTAGAVPSLPEEEQDVG